MPAIDLKKFSGLSIVYDKSELVPQENGITVEEKKVVRIESMRPQLLNDELSCPSVFYYVFCGVDHKSLLKRKNLALDLFVLPSNLAGIEYVKTCGMAAGNFPVLIDMINGYCALILQITRKNKEGLAVTKASVVKLKRGEKYIVPPNWTFLLVNTRQQTAMVSLLYSAKSSLSARLNETRGAANYIIRKNARQEIVQNPSFRNVIKPRRVCKPEDIYKVFSLTAKTPIFKQILRKYPRFRWLHDSTLVKWNKMPECV